MPDLLSDQSDRWTVDCGGAYVNRCCVDRTFQILLAHGNTLVTLSLLGRFVIVGHDTVQEFCPGEQFSELGPALSLFGKTVESFDLWKTGRLSLTFVDGYRVEMEPDPDYEAWTMSANDGLLVVCMPGGELAIWSGLADKPA